MANKRPIILHIFNSFENTSIQRIVLRLIENLGSQEYDWRIGAVSPVGDMHKEFQLLNAQVVDFSADNKSPRHNIHDYLRRNPVQIVHTHTPRTILVTARALWGLPYIPHIATKHLLTRPGDRQWGVFFTVIDRLELYLPNFLVPVSKVMAREILAQPGIRSNHVFPIPNAIPCETFYQPGERASFRAEIGLSEKSLVIGYAGRIQKVKRIDILLEAFSLMLKKFPQAHLILAGEGDMKSHFENFAEKTGIQHAVTWLGFYQNVPRFLAAVDIYAQTSVNEGLSLSILEAMSAGKPVVATCVGGEDEVITDGETGLLVDPGSVEGTADALKKLAADPSLRARIGKQAKAFVFREYNINRLVRQYHELYTCVFK